MPRSRVEPQELERLLAHAGWIRALAHRLVADAHVADDVTQRTWVAALQSPPRADQPVRRWLAAVTRNFARRSHRDDERRGRREAAAARDEARPSAHDALVRLETHRAVVEAVAELEEPYRTAILLRFFDDLPPRAIAARVGVPVATVRTRVARGLERLRAALDAAHGGERRAWIVGLLPLLDRSAPFSTTLVGAAAVNAKLVVGIVASAAVVACLGFLALERGSSPAAREPGAADRTAAAAAGAAVAPARVDAEEGRTRAAAADVAAAPTAAGARSASAPTRAAAVSTRRVRGRVLDAESRAVAGVEIGVRGRTAAFAGPAGPAASAPAPLAVSGDDGAFEIDVPDGSLELAALSQRYTTVLTGACEPTQRIAEPIVVVAPRITLAGSVVDESGRALTGVHVRLELPEDFRARFHEVLDFSSARAWSALADAGGAFELADAPEVAGAKLRAELAGFASSERPAPQRSAFDIVLRLERPRPSSTTIAGQVLDVAGAPTADASVSSGETVVKADAAGRFTVAAGDAKTVALTAAKPGLLPATLEVARGPEGWPPFVTLRLGGEALAIRGRVVAADGRAVAGATVWLANARWFGKREAGAAGLRPGADSPVLEGYLAGGARGYIAETDGAGAFHFDGLLARDYRIEAMHPETLCIARSEPIPAGSADAVLTMPRAEVFERVAGVVVNRSGAPIADVLVDALRLTCLIGIEGGRSMSYMNGIENRFRTDREGRFEIPRIAKEGVFLSLSGDAIVPTQHRVAPDADPTSLKIVVPERRHMKLELSEADAKADSFRVLDAEGQKILIRVFEGPMISTDDSAPIRGGRSDVVAVDDSARTLVLYCGDQEMRRVPLELKAGAPTVVRP